MLSTTIALIGHDNALSPRLPAGRYAAITVSDCGRGIACGDLDRVFEPFFTGNDVGHGSGLGLSQVYGFATQAGGGVGIVTAIGKGTDVTIYLPLRVRMPTSGVERHAGGTPLRTVLLVEDDDHVRRSTLQAMELLGYRVVAESNGRDALARLQDDETIDVLFTDIVMPHGMSGITLAREARTLRPGLHILLASGLPRETIESRRADEFVFLAKPYRLQDLASMLKTCGGAGLADGAD
jgi:CheY-like chemotaxis protein